MFSVSAGKGASVQGLHLSAESSEETISEAKRLSDEISEMLLAAGYFRARIPKTQWFFLNGESLEHMNVQVRSDTIYIKIGCL